MLGTVARWSQTRPLRWRTNVRRVDGVTVRNSTHVIQERTMLSTPQLALLLVPSVHQVWKSYNGNSVDNSVKIHECSPFLVYIFFKFYVLNLINHVEDCLQVCVTTILLIICIFVYLIGRTTLVDMCKSASTSNLSLYFH